MSKPFAPKSALTQEQALKIEVGSPPILGSIEGGQEQFLYPRGSAFRLGTVVNVLVQDGHGHRYMMVVDVSGAVCLREYETPTGLKR